jgi:4-hydroxy-tetrahydrodipicolinate reductase
MIKVGVTGAAGRMGRTICSAVAGDPELVLVAGVDPAGAGAAIEGIEVAETLHALADADCDVVIDFTVADAARDTVPWLALHGIHAVVGTTGFTQDDLALFESAFCGAEAPNCLIAPNFAISAVLMMRFAEAAAPYFDTAEAYPGSRGGAAPRNIRAHAVRMRGMVAHQEVILGAAGQTLTIRQDSYDRESFMPGVLLGCKRIAEFPGLTLGLDPLL